MSFYQRPLSPTPAPNSDCRQIKVFRHPNGTLGHRYVDCESSTTKQALVPSIGSRFDSKESVTYQNGPVIRPQSSNIDGRGKRGKHTRFLLIYYYKKNLFKSKTNP